MKNSFCYMMKMRSILLFALCLSVSALFADSETSVTNRAWKQANKTYTKPNHYIGLSPKIGYSQFPLAGNKLPDDATLSVPGGLHAGLEFRYKLEKDLFRMTVGLDAVYAGSSSRGTILKQMDLLQPDLCHYRLDFTKIQESQSTFEVGVPILFGANIYKGLYAMAGFRLGLPLMSSYSINTDFSRSIIDDKGIDPYTDMMNHDLFNDSKSDKGKLNLSSFNPQVAVEIGYSLDQFLASKAPIPAPPAQTGKNPVKQKLPFAQLLHYEVALYANVGVMDYHQQPAEGALFYERNGVNIDAVHSVTTDAELANGKMLPWNIGVRFNVYYEFYEQPPVPRKKKKKQRKPKPVVVDTVVEPVVVPEEVIVFHEDTIQAGDTIIMDNLYFDTDKTTIRPISEGALNELAELLQRHATVKITLIGHTDNVGKEDYNLRLSQGRVESVKSELMKRGIDGERITTVGKGESEPIADNKTAEGRAENRRVEVVFDQIIIEPITPTNSNPTTPVAEQP